MTKMVDVGFKTSNVIEVTLCYYLINIIEGTLPTLYMSEEAAEAAKREHLRDCPSSVYTIGKKWVATSTLNRMAK